MCLVVKRSGFWMVDWKLKLDRNCLLCISTSERMRKHTRGSCKLMKKNDWFKVKMSGFRKVCQSCDQTIWKRDKKVSKKINVQISGVHNLDGYCVNLKSVPRYYQSYTDFLHVQSLTKITWNSSTVGIQIPVSSLAFKWWKAIWIFSIQATIRIQNHCVWNSSQDLNTRPV